MSESADLTASAETGMLPWHEVARSSLESAAAGGRLPHALLLHGPSGVGKERFAGALAAALLCTGRGARLEACGRCAECALTSAGSHPDLYWVRRPDDRKSISVDQVREMTEQLGMTSMRRGWRVAIVVPAHAMTPNAQNALLKTLEEPAARTLLVLVTSRPSSLLPTVRSRCQRVELARPPAGAATEWLAARLPDPSPRLLELAGGAPLRALALAPHFAELEATMTALTGEFLRGERDVTATAAEMLGEGLPVRIEWLEGWLGAVARRRLLRDATMVTLPGGEWLQRATAEVNITVLFGLVDRLREVKRLLDGSAQPQLLVEVWLVDLAAAFGRQGVKG